jgi:hypothetical protein
MERKLKGKMMNVNKREREKNNKNEWNALKTSKLPILPSAAKRGHINGTRRAKKLLRLNSKSIRRAWPIGLWPADGKNVNYELRRDMDA